jgi:hypothetical protein
VKQILGFLQVFISIKTKKSHAAARGTGLKNDSYFMYGCMLYNISSSSHIIKNQMASPALLFSICCCC